jgi:hypothetical protein
MAVITEFSPKDEESKILENEADTTVPERFRKWNFDPAGGVIFDDLDIEETSDEIKKQNPVSSGKCIKLDSQGILSITSFQPEYDHDTPRQEGEREKLYYQRGSGTNDFEFEHFSTPVEKLSSIMLKKVTTPFKALKAFFCPLILAFFSSLFSIHVIMSIVIWAVGILAAIAFFSISMSSRRKIIFSTSEEKTFSFKFPSCKKNDDAFEELKKLLTGKPVNIIDNT